MPPYISAMKHDADVIIAGGGLNGLTLAHALASGGLTTIVVDPKAVKMRAKPGFDGRSYALSQASIRVLTALDLWSDLAADSQPILDIIVTDGRAGEGPSPFVLEFHGTELESGPMGQMVEDRYLRPSLIAALKTKGCVTQIEGLTVTDHIPDTSGLTVTLSDGQTLRASVLIGCDGKQSPTATRAGIKRKGWDYGQSSLVCALTHAKPHKGIAHQFFTPEGPLAILPLKGNRSSIVWTDRTDRASQIQSASEGDYLAALQPRFGDFLGDISLAGDRFTYPLSLSVAEAFVSDRIALLGDAAHSVHPIAGQGLNAGLKDVAALAETLVDAKRRGEDLGRRDVLDRYQRWRRFDTNALAFATDGFNRLFSNDNPILRTVRDLGMGAVNAMPGLRRNVIREAAGLSGDLPRLARGKSL